MKKVWQDSNNDCMTACVASILEIPLDWLPVGERRLKKAVEQYGYRIHQFPYTPNGKPPPMSTCPASPAADYYIASVTTASWLPHCVVCQNGKVVHDPDPEPEMLIDIRHYEVIMCHESAPNHTHPTFPLPWYIPDIFSKREKILAVFLAGLAVGALLSKFLF